MYRSGQEPRPERTESFRVDTDGSLVRSVVPRVGSPYEHRCTMWALKRVCWRFDEHGEGDTVETLAAAVQIPVTQAATVLAFLLERGIRHPRAPAELPGDDRCPSRRHNRVARPPREGPERLTASRPTSSRLGRGRGFLFVC